VTTITTHSTYTYLSRVLNAIANTAAMGAAYPTWTDEYCRKEVERVWLDNGSANFGRKVTIAELYELTTPSKKILGLGMWDDDLWLIPLWMFNYIADGETLVGIDGEQVVKGVTDIDFDNRFGMMAYGFEAPTQ